ncbi:TlpA disulfide reductase family protein [Haladaptatus sp. F3-133]|uniref:TlpA disulfide reductase family protein n=1 Tax=Halorutilus salinus TaxID=2487751 RepID=A0A9Q4GIW2_9EURY|nr:TlpA disulfide reductase family protein [Halorutilus salinus]
MRRRDFVAGALGVTALGAGAAYSRMQGDESVKPVEVETLDAPGSEEGVAQVPRRGEVTFVEFFATWCTVCEGMMDEVAKAHGEVGDGVQFLSVSNEPVGHTVTRDEVADWWRENGGSWTVGVDGDLRLTETLDAAGVPTTVVVDARNRVVSSGTGRKTADEIVGSIESAL